MRNEYRRQGTHTLNYGLSLVGDPSVTSVFGTASGWEGEGSGHPGPRTTAAVLTLEGGAQALWTTGPVSPRSGNPAVVHEHVRCGAWFERGRVEWQQFGAWEMLRHGQLERGRVFTTPDAFGANWIEEQAAFHRAMFAWLEHDDQPPEPTCGARCTNGPWCWRFTRARWNGGSSTSRPSIPRMTLPTGPPDIVRRDMKGGQTRGAARIGTD